MWSWLFACTSGAAPPPPTPEPAAAPDPSAEVVVVRYHEQDISKRQGHPKVHAYVDLLVTEADEALAAHARQGVLKVNMPRTALAPVAQLPWSVGQALSIRARITTSTPGYVTITGSSPGTPPPPVEALEAWDGRVGLATADLGGPGDTTPLVIRDQAAYDAFVDTLPTQRIQKKQPAPPSDDPLLKRPAVDFTQHMLLVALRDDMYVGPVIRAVRPVASDLLVEVDHPDPGETVYAARAMGVGTYHAVKVPRVDGEVRWTLTSSPQSR